MQKIPNNPIQTPKNSEKIRRYAYSQENFDQFIRFLISNGRCPQDWKEIIQLGLANTETSARALLVLARDFELVNSNYQLTQLGIDLRTNSKRGEAFRNILEAHYPDLMEIFQRNPNPFPEKQLDDCLIQEGLRNEYPRKRTIRMFKYLLAHSKDNENASNPRKKEEQPSAKEVSEEPRKELETPLQEKHHASDQIPVNEKPTLLQIPAEKPEISLEKVRTPPSHTLSTPGVKIAEQNVFGIQNSAGNQILVVIPAGSTKEDIRIVIRLLETTIS